MAFHTGETVICSIEVKNESGVLVDPATSMKITITDNRNGVEVNDQNMTKDSTGMYHYDWNSSVNAPVGIYKIIYTAVDGTRTSIAHDKVELIQEVLK